MYIYIYIHMYIHSSCFRPRPFSMRKQMRRTRCTET